MPLDTMPVNLLWETQSALCTHLKRPFWTGQKASESRISKLFKVAPAQLLLDSTYFAALPCSLQKLMEVGEFVAAGHTTCNACDKPAVQSCGRCRGVKYCNKVIPLPSACETVTDGMCRNVSPVTGRHTNLIALSSRSCEDGIHIIGITSMISITSELIISDSLMAGTLFPFKLSSLFN